MLCGSRSQGIQQMPETIPIDATSNKLWFGAGYWRSLRLVVQFRNKKQLRRHERKLALHKIDNLVTKCGGRVHPDLIITMRFKLRVARVPISRESNSL